MSAPTSNAPAHLQHEKQRAEFGEERINESEPQRRYAWLVLVIVAFVIVYIRWRLFSLPLERDEGEYAYGAQLLQEGGRLYRDLHSMKWPGIYAAYATILSLFGETREGIRTGLLLLNMANAAGIYLLAQEFLRPRFAALSAAIFLVLTIITPAHGVIANAEHFAIFWPIFGWWMLASSLRNESRTGILIAGALLGLGPVMKQHAIFFVVLGGVIVLCSPRPETRKEMWKKLTDAAIYCIGVLLVWAAMLAAIWQQGVWSEFCLWTIVYPADYTAQISLSDAPWIFLYHFLPILALAWPIFFLAGFGILKAWEMEDRRSRIWSLGLLIASVAALCPGFYFRPHYFLLIMPATAILAGFGLQTLEKRIGDRSKVLLPVLVAISLTVPLAMQSRLLLWMPVEDVSRSMYGMNPFPESHRIAAYLKEHTAPEDRIAILGSEPQICFEADRRLAGGFVYMYPLMERQPLAEKMQQMMIEEVTAAQPEYAVLVAVHTSWLGSPDSNSTLTDWMPEFLEDYIPCGLIRIAPEKKTEYHFAEEGGRIDLSQFDAEDVPNRVVLYRRKPSFD